MRSRSYLPFLILSAYLSVSSAQVNQASLGTTAAGRRAQLYLNAFNSGNDSTMKAYFERNLANDASQRVPLNQRMERFHQMLSMAGRFTLKKVLETKEDRARILVESKDGFTLKMEFQCEAADPHGLMTIAIDQVQPGEEDIVPVKDDSQLVSAAGEYVGGLAKEDRFSGVLLIARGGTPIFEKAYGLANREKNIPNTSGTRFNLGSMNKSFTQVAIHQLASDGKLSFNDPIRKFLPDYPNKEAAEKVTIENLLMMSSGIGDFFNERYETTPKKSLNTINAYLPLFADNPLAFEPGSKKQYSNGGYVVLGAIIEKASGMDYYSYVRDRIFAPVGMTGTDSYEKDADLPDIAVGYTKHGGDEKARGWKPNYEKLPQRGSSAGGGYSTAMDLLRYTKALAGPSVIPSTFEGRHGMGIAGGMEGVNAAMEWNPGNGYAIIVLSNYDPPSAERVAQHIRALLPR
jgi:CubicO group peptidase (beta-lactamase class C family)